MHSPLVRRLAAQQGVDLTTVHGTGPDGSITRADVDHAAHPVGSGAGGTVRAEDVRKAARVETPQPATTTT
ncbi:E3 binding domain-containing protein [Streptomyces silvisoli]|uniref:E3 binding domain-containing protein n=1 Tax=Streptomyces silvisoli TaxID=3034235 RepID=UPI0028BD8D8F|nr:E3 binding domain-containing protein [Streptomyces silvisoli]